MQSFLMIAGIAALLHATIMLAATPALCNETPAVGASTSAQYNDAWAESYFDADSLADVYGTAQDAISLDDANTQLLDLTNSARIDAWLNALIWDSLAATAAQAHADEMTSERYPGHVNLAGWKCNQRFNAAGGTDHVAENYVYYEVNAEVHLTPQLVERMMQHWLESATHRAVILAPEHTAVGYGCSVVHDGDTTYIAAVALFVNDYGECVHLPAVASAGDTLVIRGHVDTKSAQFGYIGIGIESAPVEHTAHELRGSAGGYWTPQPLIALAPSNMIGYAQPPTPVRKYDVQYDSGTGEYAVEITLLDGCLTGAYYITVWAVLHHAIDEGSPVCAATQVMCVE